MLKYLALQGKVVGKLRTHLGSPRETGRRFVAAKWNSGLSPRPAAQAASSPAAWAGYGDKSIKPGCWVAGPAKKKDTPAPTHQSITINRS